MGLYYTILNYTCWIIEMCLKPEPPLWELGTNRAMENPMGFPRKSLRNGGICINMWNVQYSYFVKKILLQSSRYSNSKILRGKNRLNRSIDIPVLANVHWGRFFSQTAAISVEPGDIVPWSSRFEKGGAG